MKKVIWKTNISVTDEQEIMLPEGSEILDIQIQDLNLTLWFLCDPTKEKKSRLIQVQGTGHFFDPEGLNYIKTVQIGSFVWHIFIAKEIVNAISVDE